MAKLNLRIERYALILGSVLLLSVLAVQSWALQSVTPPTKVSHATRVTMLISEKDSVVTTEQTPSEDPVPAKPKTTTKKTAKPKAAAVKPTGDIAPESVCPGQGKISMTSSVLLCMSNYARKYHGVGSLALNAVLNAAAAAKANDIVTCNQFSHTACGREFDYWITAKGYSGHCDAENIAQGQPTPGSVFVAWMNSPGHRTNILNGSYRHLGVAEQASSHGPVWVMELGGC